MSLGGIWASPLLDVTLTAGVGWLIKTTADGTSIYPYDFALLISVIWMFFISVVFLAQLYHSKFVLKKRFGVFAILFYAAFVIIIIAGPHKTTV